MEKRGLLEIVKMDNLALNAIITYWKDYSFSTVILAYAELKRRNLSIENNSTNIENFSSKYKINNIDIALSESLKNIGYSTYDECYEREVSSKRKSATQTLELFIDEATVTKKKYPALRTISSLQKIYAYILLTATIIFTFVSFFETRGMGLGLAVLSIGLLVTMIAFAIAESIMVLIDIEQNTRANK